MGPPSDHRRSRLGVDRHDLEAETFELPCSASVADAAAEVVAVEDAFVRVLVAVGDANDRFGVIQPVRDAEQVARGLSERRYREIFHDQGGRTRRRPGEQIPFCVGGTASNQSYV